VSGLQRQLLDHLEADIQVLTEVPTEMSFPSLERVVSPVQRVTTLGPEAWVCIAASQMLTQVSPQPPFERMAVAARMYAESESFTIYGSVLPWMTAPSQAPYLLQSGESSFALFSRVLAEQVADIRRLRLGHPDDTLIWAGDFNQPLVGPNRGFDNQRRTLLTNALEDLGLTARNAREEHAKVGYCAIDFICGPVERKPLRVESFSPVRDARKLSDHAGYLVEI
jgi:endonuclease/exonuclease/phosphatase family metal-dependent hydrolase